MDTDKHGFGEREFTGESKDSRAAFARLRLAKGEQVLRAFTDFREFKKYGIEFVPPRRDSGNSRKPIFNFRLHPSFV
jgi:hypothetical protein